MLKSLFAFGGNFLTGWSFGGNLACLNFIDCMGRS